MQTKNIELKSANLPKLLSDLTHSNQFLKLFSMFLFCVTLLSLATTFLLVAKPLTVITLAADGKTMAQTELPKLEDEIKAAITHYLDLRYKWTPQTVKSQLAGAQKMIHSSAIKAYQVAADNLVKFSVEKQVSQRIYANDIRVDLEKKTALIVGDRISAIQGMNAAGNLRLELSFEYGQRSSENPWGVYFLAEREH